MASISALFQIENGDYAAAEREYREAIALDSSVPYVYDNLALLLHCLSRRGEAEAAYGKARDVYDASAQAQRVRATQWDTAGLSKDAQQARERALVFEKNTAKVVNAWGALLATARNPEPAIMMYRRLFISTPNSAPPAIIWRKSSSRSPSARAKRRFPLPRSTS